MGKLVQLVVVALIGAVLCGSQCAELCAFISHQTQAKVTQPAQPEASCHKQRTSGESQHPSQKECGHHEPAIAERLSQSAASVDLPQAASAVLIVGSHLSIAPPIGVGGAPGDAVLIPLFSPPGSRSILRI